MKKIIPFLAIIILLTGCTNPVTINTVDTSSWKNYKSDTLGYSFTYPAEFNAHSNNLDGYIKIESPTMGGYYTGFIVEHYNTTFYRPDEDTTLHQIVQSIYPGFTESSSDIKIDNKETFHVAQSSSDGLPQKDIYYVIYNSQLFVLSIFYDNYEEQKDIYHTLINSFKFE